MSLSLPKDPEWIEPVRILMESAPGICLVLDSDLCLLAATESATRRFGLQRTDLGRELFDLLPRWNDFAEILQADGLRREHEIDLGGISLGKLRVSSRWTAVGNLGFHVVVFETIPQKDLEQDWFRLAVDAAPEGKLVVDSKGKIVFANKEMEKIFGYPAADLVGVQMELLMPLRFRGVHPSHRADFLSEPSARAMGAGRELFGLHKEGREFPVEIGLNPLRRNDEVFVLASIVDISQRKRLEVQLLQTQKLEGLGVLAGGIAHDFNNILTAIQGYAELVRFRKPSDPMIQEFIENILRGSKRGAELVRQMLSYAGKSKSRVEIIALPSLVKEMTQLLEVSVSKTCTLDFLADQAVPMLQGDPTQIRQIVMNLIVNASDALMEEPGVISVRLGCVPDGLAEEHIHPGFELAKREYVYLEVKDNGCGIPEDVRLKIFDPFFTTKATGRGLGLASVVGIVKAHQGGIGLVTSMGGGSTIRVYFPVQDGELRAPVPLEEIGPRDGISSGTVLVVDDERDVRNMESSMLEILGFQVIQAEDGMDALESIASNPYEFELVLLDMTMPRMNGMQTMKHIKARHPEIKVILSSGYGEPENLDLTSPTGFVGFLRKPYNFSELTAAVELARHK